ncbi:unnamed protein product [Protopolystoma xenopodis]|uniref:Uncharacterized protein n=1 Tax=Protopolystoma xenopodis TaxID=117903 RepID=A0A3S5CSA4_9PLAT|nr:unnamed protein product [Protopolystoma xenopodis]
MTDELHNRQTQTRGIVCQNSNASIGNSQTPDDECVRDDQFVHKAVCSGFLLTPFLGRFFPDDDCLCKRHLHVL